MNTCDLILKLIMKNRFPLTRKKETTSEFLKNHFSDYTVDLKNAVADNNGHYLSPKFYSTLDSNLGKINNLCNDIVNILNCYNSGAFYDVYKITDDSLRNIKPFLFEKVIGSGACYYRIRPGNSDCKRENIFHISEKDRGRIRSYRYSIAGYPCLYLAEDLELCWFECGMPSEFNAAKFKVEPTGRPVLKLIDFTANPLEVAREAQRAYIDHPDNTAVIDSYIFRYLVTYPLRCACSIYVENKGLPFVEEYIFPQLLLSWVRQNQEFDGISYSTALSFKKAWAWNSHNIVLPSKEIDCDGYCKRLKSIFKITLPVKVSISNILSRYDSEIERTQNFLENLEHKLKHSNAIYLYREIISLTTSFLLLVNDLKSDSGKSPEMLYQFMETINHVSYLITDNKDTIEKNVISKSTTSDPVSSQNDLLNEYRDTIKEFESIVKPFMFELRGYVKLISVSTSFDEGTYEYIK